MHTQRIKKQKIIADNIDQTGSFKLTFRSDGEMFHNHTTTISKEIKIIFMGLQ